MVIRILNLKIVLLLCSLTFQMSCSKGEQSDFLIIENDKIKLEFSTENGAFIGFQDFTDNYQFLEKNGDQGLPWGINFHKQNDSLNTIGMTPTSFEYFKPDRFTLILKWGAFKGFENNDFEISATISLDKEEAFSYWKISIDGIEDELINDVVFPKISGIKDMGQEELAVPSWMGQKLNGPRDLLATSTREVRNMVWDYPGHLSLQLLTLYNPSKIGLYTASNDTEAFRKSFSLTLDDSDNFTYEMTNYPALDPLADSYETPYEAVIGSFHGDWITAAEQYREWGSKQEWATQSRLKTGETPKWLEETALWVWNRGRSENVLIPASDLKQRLGLPVNVFWHWWHGTPYDAGFPEYFPPKEGKESFVSAMKKAQEKDIRSIVYMNSFQWGNSTESWEDENASAHAVKDINGNLRSHVYNVFTGDSLTNMCMATQFWRDKYSSLSDKAINEHGINGVYMDQATLHRPCYDPTHGHPLGGGNYWVTSFGKLTNQIRNKIPQQKQAILAGEGAGESWMPYLDLFLTLKVSSERYAGVGLWESIPFYQAVYHQYAITYGSYSSLVTPPYDELWPDEFAPDNQEQPLDSIFSKQFLMEQARSYVWGMQPTISNYHDFLASEREQEIEYLMNIARVRYEVLKYLLHGKFIRTPAMEVPEEELDISKLSIYVGQKGESVTKFKEEFPLVYSGAWEANDGNIGIALTSIGDTNIPVNFKVDTEDYGLAPDGEVYITNTQGRVLLTSYDGGEVQVNYELQPREVGFIEIISNSL